MGLKKLILLLILTSISVGALAQSKTLEFEISPHYRLISKASGFDPGPNGSSFSIAYAVPVYTQWGFQSGLEIGTNGIATYSGIIVGIQHRIVLPWKKFHISTGIHTMQGAALFQQNALYMARIYSKHGLAYAFNSRSQVILYLKPAYIVSPSYKEYSAVNAFFDLDLGISFCIHLLPE